MSLIKYLARLGYGSRREVTALLAARRVTTDAGTTLRDGDPWTHDAVRVDGAPLDPPPGAVVLLHKPTGYVCSTQDVPPLIYELLPPRFTRRTPVMATVGRLDRDTSGLLLLTDDGALNHRLTSPRRHVPKTYRVTLAEHLRGDEGAVLARGGLHLHDDDGPLAPAAFTPLGPRAADLTIIEGRYHQVRRTFAALGNHVVTLHRTAMGPLVLGDLAEGAWRVLSVSELAQLDRRADASPPAP